MAFLLTPTKGTGTITAATANGSSQELQAARAGRVNITIQNTSDTIMYLKFGAAATSSNGFAIAAGTTWQNPPGFCPTNSINVIGTNTKTYSYMIY